MCSLPVQWVAHPKELMSLLQARQYLYGILYFSPFPSPLERASDFSPLVEEDFTLESAPCSRLSVLASSASHGEGIK